MMRPSDSTNTFSARLITACMTCSIMTMVMPRSAMARITGTMSRISDGLRPASTSSSRSSRGSIASARASSSRLRPATVRLAAGRSSAIAKTRPRARRRLRQPARRRARGRDRCEPTAMFSRTVRPANGCTIWKVRAMPRRASRSGGSAGDVVAGIDDAAFARRQEAGDDREQGGLAGAVRTDQRGDASGKAANEALFTASRPPKRLETFSTWSNASAIGRAPRCGLLTKRRRRPVKMPAIPWARRRRRGPARRRR